MSSRMIRLDHLSETDHLEAARLLTEVQDRLWQLGRMGKRAAWSDRCVRVQKAVQERLIDPLSEAREMDRERRGLPREREAVYPSAHYAVGWR